MKSNLWNLPYNKRFLSFCLVIFTKKLHLRQATLAFVREILFYVYSVNNHHQIWAITKESLVSHSLPWLFFLLILHTSSINTLKSYVQMIRNHHNNWKGHKYLVKLNKCPVAYYPNLTTTFNVILESNDTEKNLWPTQVNNAPSSDKSEKVIRSNAKRCICISCSSLTYPKCANISQITKFTRVR